MLTRFSDKFIITTSSSTVDEDKDFYRDLPKELFELMNSFGGSSFNNGLYRIHSFKSSMQWSLLIAEYFNQYNHKIYPFSFDWMGRQFCLSISNSNTIYMFDPATGEDFELQQTIYSFHNEDLVNDTDDMLAINLFKKVLAFYKINNIGYNKCMGYKTPLFLGGKDGIENYEIQDMEVYWHITNQLYKQVKDLPGGTKIKNINFNS